jgi:hypothetical protein
MNLPVLKLNTSQHGRTSSVQQWKRIHTKKPGRNAGLLGMLKPQCNRMAQAGQASIFQVTC